MSRTTLPLIVLDDVTGRYVPNAQVSVFLPDGTTPAPVYTGNTGTTTRTQPLLTDAYGRVSGWLDRGSYEVHIVISGHPTRIEYYDSAPGADGTVDTGWLASSAVTTAKINDAAVTTPKIADAAISTAKIADDSITDTKLQTNSVTTVKIADDAIIPSKIPDHSITSQKLALGISAGNRTLLRRNFGGFRLSYTNNQNHSFLSVKNQPNVPYDYRNNYYYPYYYYNYYHFYGLDTQETPTPLTLNNVSSTVSVSLFTGGTVTNSYYNYYYYPYYYYNLYNNEPQGSDISVKVILDGVEYDMIDKEIKNNVPNVNYYYPYAYYYTPGIYNNVFLSKTFTGLTPGDHTWNIKISKGSFEYYNEFVSAGYSLLTIQEEPSVV